MLCIKRIKRKRRYSLRDSLSNIKQKKALADCKKVSKGLLFYIIEIERDTLLSASVLVKSSFILCVLCGLNRIFDLFGLFG